MTQDLSPIDGFDAYANDPTSSPIRGTNTKFIDGEYFAFADQIDVRDEAFVVLDQYEGWQKLARGCPPEYLMQKKGEPRPPRPHVDEKDWPDGLNGKPEHPWKFTTYLWLLNAKTGETSTFWTNTVGGNIAVGELSEQVALMRHVRPHAMPVIALESRDMPTQYGSTKPRPYFRILGWRQRSEADSPAMLAAPAQKEPIETPPTQPVAKVEQALEEVKKPTSEEILNDGVPAHLTARAAPAESLVYCGFGVEKTGKQFTIQKDGRTVHVAASKQAAKAWIDAQHKPIAAG